MHHDDGIAGLKAKIAEDFPSWRLLVSSSGRWWALCGPLPGEAGPDALEADSFDELYALLAATTMDQPKPQVVIPVATPGFISGPYGV